MEMPRRPLHRRRRRAAAAWLFRQAILPNEPGDARAAVISLADAPSGSVRNNAVVTVPLVENFCLVDGSASPATLVPVGN
jgi:hypothetical protein